MALEPEDVAAFQANVFGFRDQSWKLGVDFELRAPGNFSLEAADAIIQEFLLNYFLAGGVDNSNHDVLQHVALGVLDDH